MVAPTKILIVGAIHESPVFVRDMRLFSGAPRRSPTGCFFCVKLCSFSRDAEDASPTKNFKLFRRGEPCSPAFMRDMRSFREEASKLRFATWQICFAKSPLPYRLK